MDDVSTEQLNSIDLEQIMKDIIDFINKDQSKFAMLIKKSLQLIQQQLALQNKICFTYNGGKDSTLVLYLLLTYFYERYKESYLTEFNKQILVLYLDTYEQFFECTEYINSQLDLLQIKLIKYKGNNLISAIQDFLNDYNEIRSFFIGIRIIDKQQVQEVQESTPNYPKFIRITPILDYSLCDVWEFLLRFKIPYCSMYKNGYTSIGTIENTHQNVNIKQPGRKIFDYLLERGLNQEELQKLINQSPEHSILLPLANIETERQSR